MTKVNFEKVDEFLKKQPTGSYGAFLAEYPDQKLSDATFYSRRLKICGKKLSKKSKKLTKHYTRKSAIYQTIFRQDLTSLKLSPVEIIKKIVSDLNFAIKARLEVQEVVGEEGTSNILEIRRVAK